VTLSEPGQDAGPSAPAGIDLRNRRPVLSWLRWWLVAGLIASAALPLNAGLSAVECGVHPVAAVLAGIGHSAAPLLILVRLHEATALQFLAVALFAVTVPPGAGSTWPLTVPRLLTLIAHIGLVAACYSRQAALTTWGASALLIPAMVLLDPQGRSVADGLLIMILYPVLSAIVLSAVMMTRHWREIRRELADARRDIELQHSRRAVAKERTRIARDLHDVVAHGMSVIHMPPTSASYRIKNLGPEAKAEFVRIAAARGLADHGLPGMRERIPVVGGSLEENARADGGFRVTARMPTRDPQ
jgi:signal transduction histidine kinase